MQESGKRDRYDRFRRRVFLTREDFRFLICVHCVRQIFVLFYLLFLKRDLGIVFFQTTKYEMQSLSIRSTRDTFCVGLTSPTDRLDFFRHPRLFFFAPTLFFPF